MSGKQTKILMSSLIENSGDSFRSAFGGFYQNIETELGDELAFVNADTNAPNDSEITKIFFDTENQTTKNNENLIPYYTFPVRIVSNSENIINDDNWSSYILGGTYSDNFYNSKISAGTHEYINFSYEAPYTKLESMYLESSNISNILEISYDYTQHLERYQNTIQNFESELLIPNYYIISDYYQKNNINKDKTNLVYPTEMLNLISIENTYETPEFLFSFNNSNIPYEVPSSITDSLTDIRKLNTNLTIDYLNSTNFISPVTSSNIDWALTKQKTILFDNKANENILNMEQLQDCLPFKIKVSFPTHATKQFVEKFVQDEFDNKILTGLNEAFVRQQEYATTEKTYNTNIIYLSSSGDSVVSIAENNSSTNRQIDYIEFLSYLRNQYVNTDNEIMFVGENTLPRLSALDTDGTYRYHNILKSTEAIKYATEFLNSSDYNQIDWDGLFSDKETYNETIAYRIEKIGGIGSGDGLTQNVIQNFWFINSSINDMNFTDNQVRTGIDYTYRVYAYMIVAGLKYQYSDILTTKDLGCEIEDYNYGLEFYNGNGQSTERLFDDGKLAFSQSEFDDSAGGDYGTKAQIYSNYKYASDFKITYQPILKVVEIPIYSKTFRILDNPPNKFDITPFQILNDEQKIGFKLKYGVFGRAHYPSTINTQDDINKSNYMMAKDYLDTTKISHASVSKQRYMEVFRIENKPNSVKDFDNNLIRRIDLRNYEQNYNLVDEVFINQIKANQKYYYIFRAVNENGISGHLSEIYEVELINDGGYKFALFNTLLESDLEEEKEKTYSKPFKKIFQLRPNLSQLQIDPSNADFLQDAKSQLGNIQVGYAEDLIWDKTFKVRLTSKKTSKKIDINITYKIGSE